MKCEHGHDPVGDPGAMCQSCEQIIRCGQMQCGYCGREIIQVAGNWYNPDENMSSHDCADELKTERDKLLLQIRDLQNVVDAARAVDAQWKRACTYDTEEIRTLRRALETWTGRRGMVWKACPEHRQHEKKPFNWGPPPWHPCPNCEYRDITGSTEIGPETFTEKRKCECIPGVHKPCPEHGFPAMRPLEGPGSVDE